MPHEFIIQRQLRLKYDRSMTIPGGRLVEVGDVVAVQLHRDTFKANKLDGSPNDPNWATSYFWELLSIVPSDGQVDAGAPTRPPAAGTPATGHPAPTPPAFQVEGVVKGHCENIIAQLAIARLLPQAAIGQSPSTR